VGLTGDRGGKTGSVPRKSDGLWELQWHPSGGGHVRRLVLTRRGIRRSLTAIAALLLVVLAIIAMLPIGLRGVLAKFTVNAARRENRDLRNEGARLHEAALRACGLLATSLDRARRLAWVVGAPSESWRPPVPMPPGEGSSDDAIVGWLTAAADRLAELEGPLAGVPTSLPCPLGALPTGRVLAPADAVPVALFGWQVSPFTGKREAHHGATLAAPRGKPVLAAGAGTVAYAGAARERRANEWTRFGIIVIVDHGGGVSTIYAHLDATLVRRGQTVTRGERIGTVGQTGWTRVPAVYFEVRWPLGGVSTPLSPALFSLSLPTGDLDALLADPSGGLPADYARLEHLALRRG